MADLKSQTPVEIDTALAEIWERSYRPTERAVALRQRVKFDAERVASGRFVRRMSAEQITKAIADAEKFEAERDAILAEAVPFEAEFEARGRWNRYYLVDNTGGHIHRERNCTTCFFSTVYSWLVDLADYSESTMVLRYGEKACTICFPTAPSMAGWGEYGKREKAERAATKAAKKAEKEAGYIRVEFPEAIARLGSSVRTFKTQRAAEIELVQAAVRVREYQRAIDNGTANSHWGGLRDRDQSTVDAIGGALGELRGVNASWIVAELSERIRAKLKRDDREAEKARVAYEADRAAWAKFRGDADVKS